jgi:hypothetical protein
MNTNSAYRQAFTESGGGFEFTGHKGPATGTKAAGAKGADADVVYAWVRTQIIPYVGSRRTGCRLPQLTCMFPILPLVVDNRLVVACDFHASACCDHYLQ